jgi:hypothetical protein
VVSMLPSGTFGGLVVSMLASGTFGGLVVSMLASGTFGGLMVSMLASGNFGGLMVSMLASGTFGGLVVSVLASGTFGGLVVSMLVAGTQDRGFAPGRSRRIFRAKILSMPSFGRELKPFAPCRRFAACQRPLKFTVEFANYRLNCSDISRPLSFLANRGLFCRLTRSASRDDGRN